MFSFLRKLKPKTGRKAKPVAGTYYRNTFRTYDQVHIALAKGQGREWPPVKRDEAQHGN